ncbi:hemicentin-1-like [Ptychodera flava]|uniref:hemicentin-1-like n=1 Tax=Ptychodera flava TaxID=63121 RepID=UPI003969DD10
MIFVWFGYLDVPIVSTTDKFVGIEGTAFTATCTADANPPAHVEWLDESGTVVSDHELKFDAVHRNDGGEYKCEATNMFWDWSTGAGSETRYLDVQYDPDVQDSEQFCLEGNDVTLHCDVDANPEPHSFSWTRDSETVSDQQNHTISSCQREDSGSYICTAINHFYDDTEGKGDGTTVLDVQYHPVVADGLEYCIEGNSVELVCVVEEANPYPHSFTWTRDGQFVYSGERLVIQSCDRSDLGSYKCTATSEFYNGSEGQGEGTTELIVHYPPSVHTQPFEYARESDDVELECSVQDANPPKVVLDWILTDGTRVENSTTLHLPNVGRDSGGVYTCEGTNVFYDGSEGTGRNTTDLDVQYGPEVADGQEHCIEGNVVELTCDVVANPPPHSITWTKDGDVISENPTYTIDSCDRVQAGDYDCTAVNEFYDGEEGTGHGRTELLVEYTGQVTITQSTDLVLEGEELEIRCDVTDGIPDPHELSLTFGEEVLVTTNSRQLIHHIAVVSRSERGTYRCDAITRFHDSSTETITDSLEIVVQFPASILTKEEEILAETGENVTLVCEADAYPVAAISWSDNDDQPITGDEPNRPPIILSKDVKVLEVEINDNVTLVCEADAYPVATLSWHDKNDDPITGDEPNREITTPEPKESISTSTLRIFEMQDPDFGEYTCEAENDLGDDSHTGEVIRKDPAESLLWGLLLIILLIVVLLIVFFVLLYLVLRNNRKSSKIESPDETDSRVG